MANICCTEHLPSLANQDYMDNIRELNDRLDMVKDIARPGCSYEPIDDEDLQFGDSATSSDVLKHSLVDDHPLLRLKKCSNNGKGKRNDNNFVSLEGPFGSLVVPHILPEPLFSWSLIGLFSCSSFIDSLPVKDIARPGCSYEGTKIETVVYADSDHAGYPVDQKSTSGIYTFVGCCLTSWFSKKQTALAISTIESEYVIAGKALNGKTRNKPKELLPYGMLLTRLFKHAVSVSPELAFDHYLSHDRAMHLLAPHYERKTRSDNGKKRPRKSMTSSPSSNHHFLSLPLDSIGDENDDESFHSHYYSSSQNISSSSNVVLRVCQNIPHESQDLNTYLSETINIQTQQRDAHCDGLKSIGQSIKDMMRGKRH
nr:uncharacterized mitochondrial protein AtMg00810-like [Tanacetum cinerariifolium]